MFIEFDGAVDLFHGRLRFINPDRVRSRMGKAKINKDDMDDIQDYGSVYDFGIGGELI